MKSENPITDEMCQGTEWCPRYKVANMEREMQELEATINTLHNLCVSAEKRAFKKLEAERAAAGSNDKLNHGGE